MNVLEHHLRGDTSGEYLRWCLARHVAHWNSSYREWWLTTKWQAEHGEASTDALRQQVSEARYELIKERDRAAALDKQATLPIRDRTAGRIEIEKLRALVQ